MVLRWMKVPMASPASRSRAELPATKASAWAYSGPQEADPAQGCGVVDRRQHRVPTASPGSPLQRGDGQLVPNSPMRKVIASDFRSKRIACISI